jgi:hypothetical protein
MKTCVSPKTTRPSTSCAVRATTKKCFAILLELRPLMGMLRILDGEMVQAELVPHAVQQLRIGLQEAYPDDMALLVGPISGIIDGNIGDAPAIGIDAGGDDTRRAMFGRRCFGGRAVESGSEPGAGHGLLRRSALLP